MTVLDKEMIRSHSLIDQKLERRIECLSLTEDYGKFIIEPLKKGFGVTIGNSLRRVLMSSLPGAAVTWVKIEGILHEFSTISGVMEDTTDIILNLKKLRIKMYSDEPRTLRLEARGEREVKAEDFIAPPEVEILNKDLHLATLVDKDAKLFMEVGVSQGVGYIPAEKHSFSEQQIIGLIPVDSIFIPIRKVNYFIEDIRVGQTSDYERLIMEVWTDKSISPDEAISQAANIIQEYLSPLVRLKEVTMKKKAEGEEKEVKSIIDMNIEELNLSVRSYNCLKRAGITTIGELLQYSEADIMNVKNFGVKSLEEIKEKLQGYNLSLRKD